MTERADTCAGCAAPLAADQRYCVRCGERRWALPHAVARMLGLPVAVEGPPDDLVEAGDGGGSRPRGIAMPDARAAAVAVMAILAFGVVVGSVISPPAESATPPTIVAVSPPAAPPAPAAPTSAPVSAPAAALAPAPAPVQQTITQTVQQPAPPATTPTTPAPPPTPQLPPVKHVFLIVLSGHGYDAAFGANSQAPYLATTLTKQGELLSNYFAVTSGELANEIALVSGQGPNPDTAANCPQYGDVTPGTVDQDPQQPGQIQGSGCVFPTQALTLPDELVANGDSWKAYVEDIGNGGDGQPATCRHPAAGTADADQAPRPGDAYVTWRNPFVYFHSIVDVPGCATNDVGLDQLATDLESPATTPSLSYIVPNRCHDGADDPCAPDQAAGLPAADAFLKTVIPQIMASPAYKADGLIAITFDQAPQSGPEADSSACCTEPAYPNLPAPAAPPAAPPAATTTTSTTPATTTPAGQTPPPAPLPPGADSTTGGGGRVGLLLISKFVKPGTANAISSYNHYSLLRSIEDLFGLQPTGYAGFPGLLAFDSVIYNAPTASTASASRARSGSSRAIPARASAVASAGARRSTQAASTPASRRSSSARAARPASSATRSATSARP